MKMKRFQSIIALTLCAAMFLAATACTRRTLSATDDSVAASASVDTSAAPAETSETETQSDETSFTVSDDDEEIYMNNLGNFYDAYEEAVASDNVSESYALLAIAEAKALESGVCTPMYGGTAGYNMSRIVYCSNGYAPWRGTMSDMTHMLVTNEIILKEDYDYLKTLWSELVGSGTYLEKAKEYLTSKGYTFRDTYTDTFVDNPTTWDIFAASTSNDTGIIGPTYDFLFAYNAEGEMEPHLAESCDISDDGMTYTIHIRPGQIWVDSQGRKIADVVADDWVAAAQHAADLQNCYDLNMYIAGMTEYLSGENTDFSAVGIKALDDYTLQYTLKEPATYFMSLFQGTDFVPLCRSYFLSQGGAFGLDAYAAASALPSYVYGTDQNHIAICGQFLCTNMTEKNSVTYVLNKNYWAADQVNLKAVKLVFNDGSDVSRVYDDFINGNTVTMYLNASRIELAKKRGDFEKYAFVNDVGRISFLFWFNMHRQTYANMADGTAPSQKTDLEKEISIAALQNVHFRLAIGHSIDRASYLAQNVGEELKSISIRNTMTPGTYVKLDEPATVKINGEDVTFDENTWYGAIVQAQLDADGFPVTVWDSENETTDGWDAWYNPELAAQELALAIKDLAALGYDVSAENPIVIDYPYPSYNEVGQNQAYVLKTCIEGALGGLVRFDALPLNDVTEFLNVENNTNSGAEHNTDMGGLGCIGSDHGDPRCYLDGMLPYGDGAFTPRMGLW